MIRHACGACYRSKTWFADRIVIVRPPSRFIGGQLPRTEDRANLEPATVFLSHIPARMLQRKSLLALAVPATVVLTAGAMSDDGRAGRTGSPGETTCHNCHNDFTANSGGGSVVLGSTNMTGWEYVPGTNYHMTATVSRAGNQLFGIGLEALSASNTNAGTLVITDAESTQIKNAVVNGVSRRNVVHTLNGGVGNGSKTFQFDWNAPSSNIGNVTFYFAGVAANGDGNEEVGDYVYNSSQVVTPALNTGMEDLSLDAVIRVQPNPVTDRIILSYGLAAADRVTADLYDVSGALVRSLVNAERGSGRHVETITGLSDLPPGVLMLRTAIGGKVQVTRIVVDPVR